MCPSNKSVASAGTRLVSFALAVGPGSAWAATDPFAIGSGSNVDRSTSEDGGAQQTLFAEAIIDGATKARAVRLQGTGNALEISGKDAEYLGLTPKSVHNGFAYLRDIPGITFQYDTRFTRLEIMHLRHSDGPNLVNLAGKAAQRNDGRSLTAFVLDYDFALTTDRRGATLAGLAGARLSRGSFVAETNFLVNTRPDRGSKSTIRLDSSATIVSRDQNLRAVLGDFVSAAPASGRAVRLGGVQISHDYSARPDLVTYPLPAFNGSVAVPSGVDVLISDRRISTNSIDPGDFTIRNIPVPVGRNQVGVVVRNALGVEQVQTVQLYATQDLLAKGLSTYSVNAGFVRQRYGLVSNDYGLFGITAAYRRGISDRLTLEGSLEAANGIVNGGLGAAFTVGALGVASLDVRASHASSNLSLANFGRYARLGFQSQGNPISFSLEATLVSKSYRDLASRAGDSPPVSRFAASIDFDLARYGRLQFTSVSQRRRNDRNFPGTFLQERTSLISVRYRKTLRERVSLFADVTQSLGQRSSTALLLGLSASLGGRSSASISASRQGGRSDYQLSYARPDVQPGDWGFRLDAGTGQIDRAQASLAYRGGWGRIEAQAEHINGYAAARLGARGSIIIARDAIFAANLQSGSFALVETGKAKGLPISRENRFAGRTGGGGRLLITDLPAYVPIKLSLDAAQLPETMVARNDRATVVAPFRGGTLVHFDVEVAKPVTLRLLQSDGAAVPPGTLVRLLPSKEQVVVGFDGMIEFNIETQNTAMQWTTENGATCFADAALPKTIKAYDDAGERKCGATINAMSVAEFLAK